MSSGNFWKKLKRPILALAPMAGITDSAFRELCREAGADVVYTEMVSADGLYHDSKKTMEFLKFSRKEKPVVIQLFGKQPEKFSKAARLCEQAGFDGIDINFGCPAKKVAGHGGGVTLTRDLDKCRAIIEATLSGTKLPLSIKLRSSINKQQGEKIIIVTAVDFLDYLKGLPLVAIMIHGRSFEMPFEGEPDYAMIKAVKKIFNGIVLGNGGIKSPEAAKKMLELTGVDGVGLARGVYGKPWLFKQTKDYLKKGRYSEIKKSQIKKYMIRHAQLIFANKGSRGLFELRKHLLWYVSGWPGARELRSRLVRVESIDGLKKVLKEID